MDKENKAIIDLLAEGLVKQDELSRKVDVLASAMLDSKEIVASQTRSMETMTQLMQEQRDDIRDIRYLMDKSGTVRQAINSLNERVGELEEKLKSR